MDFLEVMNLGFEKPVQVDKGKAHFGADKKQLDFKNIFQSTMTNRNMISKEKRGYNENEIYANKFPRDKEFSKISSLVRLSSDKKNTKTEAMDGEDCNKIEHVNLENKKLDIVKETLEELQELDIGNLANLQQILEALRVFFDGYITEKSFETVNDMPQNVVMTQNLEETLELIKQAIERVNQNEDDKSLFATEDIIKENKSMEELERLIAALHLDATVENNSEKTGIKALKRRSLKLDYQTGKDELENGKWMTTKEIEKEVKLNSKDESKILIKEVTDDDKENIAKDLGETILTIEKETGTDTIRNQKFETIAKQELEFRNNVAEQVVKKIKFVSGDNFSELKIQLKPESLGKLILKVVLEEGQLTAKFTAQNNQVKGIIESSFAELKDSLQEKGINVQNLSVSVGNEDRSFSEMYKKRENMKKQNNLKKWDAKEVDLQLDNINPYENSEVILDVKV